MSIRIRIKAVDHKGNEFIVDWETKKIQAAYYPGVGISGRTIQLRNIRDGVWTPRKAKEIVKVLRSDHPELTFQLFSWIGDNWIIYNK